MFNRLACIVLMLAVFALPIHADDYTATLESYGVVGDGATDDTTNLQAAIDDSSSTGKVLLAKASVYLHTGLTWKASARLRGVGPKKTFLRYSATSGDAITMGADVNNAEISELAIDCSTTSTGWAIKASSSGLREFLLNRFEIEDFKSGIDIYNGINGRITHGRINGQGSGVSGSVGVKLGDATAGSLETTTMTLDNLYASDFELCLNLDGGDANRFVNSICANTVTAIRNRGKNYSAGSYFEGLSGNLIENVDGGYGMVIMMPTIFNDSATRIEDPIGTGIVDLGDSSSTRRTKIFSHLNGFQ